MEDRRTCFKKVKSKKAKVKKLTVKSEIPPLDFLSAYFAFLLFTFLGF